jgi:hypothetical protein
MDWAEACRILGVPESATDTEIKEQYIYKAQLLHPDKNQDKPENIRKKAEAELALVNQAYSILSNPNNNPFKIPPKLVVEPMRIRFKDVNIGERKSTTLTIRNVGGPYSSVWIDNQPAPWLKVTSVKSITSDRLPLEVTLESTGIGEPGQQYLCNLLIKLENETTHIVDQANVNVELNTQAALSNSSMEKKLKPLAPGSPDAILREKPASSSMPQKKIGFSAKTFIANILAFGILGIVAVYLIRAFLTINEVAFIVGLICYIGIAFAFSFNHAFTIGSRSEKNQRRNKK